MSYYTVVENDGVPFFRGIEMEDVKRVSDLEAAGYPEDEAANFESISSRAQNAPGCFLVALRQTAAGDELIGFVNGTLAKGDTLTHETMSTHVPDGDLLCIHSVCVDEPLRRQKVGSRMLKAYVAYVQQSTPQIRRLALICKEHLVDFYANAGFTMVGPSTVVHGKDPWFEMIIDIPQD